MVQFQYWFRDGRCGIVCADNPQQVLDGVFGEYTARLRNDTHVDHIHWKKHFHYYVEDWHSGKVLGEFRGTRDMNRRGH